MDKKTKELVVSMILVVLVFAVSVLALIIF